MNFTAPEVEKLTNDNVGLSLSNLEAFEASLQSFNHAQSVQSIARGGDLSKSVAQLVTAAVAENTRRAYRQDLEDFQRWGGAIPCAPEMLAAYIADRAATLSPYTITRRVVGISRAHASQGLPDPAKNDLLRTILRGVRRKHGAPQRQVAPLLKQDLLAILPHMRGTKGLRDRALILLGFAAALRRSELVALDVQDLQFVKEGALVHLRRSKTDQQGEGRRIAVPYGRTSACPVKAVQHWLEHAQINEGPIYRSVGKGGHIGKGRLADQSVALILKAYASLAGLNTSNISGHSLRSGLVTSAAQAGVATHKIQQQTGHRSVEMLWKYIRDANLFENNAAGLLL